MSFLIICESGLNLALILTIGYWLLFLVVTGCCSSWLLAVVPRGYWLLVLVVTGCCSSWLLAVVPRGYWLLFLVVTGCCSSWLLAVVPRGYWLLFLVLLGLLPPPNVSTPTILSFALLLFCQSLQTSPYAILPVAWFVKACFV